MPDDVNASNVPPTPATQATPGGTPSTASTADPARATDGRFEPKEWRYPSDYPVEYLRNKTAEEAARYTDMLYQQVRSNTPPQQAQPVRPQGAPPAPYSQAAPPTQEDFLTDPAGATQRAIAYAQQTQLDPWAQQVGQNQAQMARNLIELREAEAFRRWGPEIDVEIQRQIPDARYRSPEALKLIVDIVRSRHVEELAEERMQAKLRSMPQSMRADGAVGGGTSANAGGSIDFSSAGLPENYTRVLARANIKPETLDEFLQMTEVRTRGITLDQARQEWLDKAKKGDIITEASLRLT